MVCTGSTSWIRPDVWPQQMTPQFSTSAFSKNILQAVLPAMSSATSLNSQPACSLAKTRLATSLLYMRVEFWNERRSRIVSISLACSTR